MIRHIKIKNFAIIENVEVDFHDGLNIITGETGAGKSIVIEAVSLALGSRADTAFVRSGEEKALVQMVADYKGREYIISREVSAAGRNVCRINDEIVTLGTLNALCRQIADVHGQYDHQSLLDPDNHIKLVDSYQSDVILPLKSSVADLYGEFSGYVSELQKLRRQAAENLRQRDFMAFELKEIQDAHLVVGEDEELEEQVLLLQNSEKIYSDLAGAYQIASDSEFSLLSAMKQVSSLLADSAEYSPAIADLQARVDNLYYEFEDACGEIRDCRDKAVFSPEELDAAIGRLEQIGRLKNKHGMSVEELLAYAGELESKLAVIDNADEYAAELTGKIEDCRARLTAACAALTVARKDSASRLETLILKELSELNFRDAEFAIDFKSTLENKSTGAASSAASGQAAGAAAGGGDPLDVGGFTADGTDIVEFLITTNRGETLKPLSKIASGGEMSRIMLAFKKIIADYDEIPTMIFDEIDSGISGIAASVVGRKMLEIAQNHQIICITHLPQIAAYGTSNYRIAKNSDESMTYTTVEELSYDEKVSEIARLLGGETITDITLASARELIASAK